MKKVFIVSLLFCMMLIAPIAWGAIIHVPGDQPTIQAGIDASSDGDTVLVADGTYTGDGNKNLDFKGKIIEVRSENGPASTIIDCENDGLGFYFHSGEGKVSVVDGFTITNGSGKEARGGGGIFCIDSAPTITNNIITGNTTDHNGGGIYCYQSEPRYPSPVITNNTITGNKASHGGDGGGIACYQSSPVIANNIIMENRGSGIGAMRGGGGIYCEHSSPVITNNTIAGNLGGGIYCEKSNPVITNNTIVENSTTKDKGNGIRCFIHSSPIVINTILWANREGVKQIYLDDSAITVTYSNIQGGWPGEGNIDADPLFVDPGNGDYHLKAGSPCIDAGDPNSPLDPDGTRADMGAFYYSERSERVKKPTTTDFGNVILPSRSMLLPNYPNPFKLNPFNPTPWIPYHPKTWIPYLLAIDASVTIRIYNTKGQLIHTIELGNKKAGTYMLKDKAAIWDGRDDTGVRVGSGIYFYTLQAGDFIATRRMVIY